MAGAWITLNMRDSGGTPQSMRLWDPSGAGAGPFSFAHVVEQKAIAHGTNPTAIAAGERTEWYANRAGVPFVMGGHPNVITRAHIVTDADGAQTDAILLTVGSGAKAVITRMTVICDNANTGDVAVTIGFGTANVPTVTLAGVAGVVVNGSFDGGAGVTLGDGSGILAVGADNEDLRLTCSDPVAGNLRISYSYYTIET